MSERHGRQRLHHRLQSRKSREPTERQRDARRTPQERQTHIEPLPERALGKTRSPKTLKGRQRDEGRCVSERVCAARGYHWRNISEARPQAKGIERAVCIMKEGIYANWLALERHCNARIALESPLLGYLVGRTQNFPVLSFACDVRRYCHESGVWTSSPEVRHCSAASCEVGALPHKLCGWRPTPLAKWLMQHIHYKLVESAVDWMSSEQHSCGHPLQADLPEGTWFALHLRSHTLISASSMFDGRLPLRLASWMQSIGSKLDLGFVLDLLHLDDHEFSRQVVARLSRS